MKKKRTSCPRAAWRGFTLIEIMTVVAIIGILAALALPNYIEHVRRGHRAEARAALLQATQWLERAATASGSYPAGLPEPLKTVPGGRYDIALAADGTRFMLTATPKGSQFGDKCGSLTLNQAGERGLRGNAAELADCWDR